VNHGANGTEVTAVPNTGYHFVDWSDGVLTPSRTDLNVTGNINVTAAFGLGSEVLLIAPTGTLTSWDNLFEWTGIASADYYRLEVYDDSDTLIYGQWYTDSICTSLECALSPADTLNLANGDYRWRVQTYGSAGFSPYTDFMSFTLNAPTLQLIAPSGALTAWDNRFEWTGSSAADYYRLQVTDGSETVLYDQWYTNSICTGLECALSPAATLSLANGDYKWRVQTYGPAGFSSFTPFATFTLNVPTLNLVAPRGTLTAWTNTFSWTGNADADYYRLEVYDDSDTLIYGQWYTDSICTGLDCALSPADTLNLANGDYRWRVQTYGPAGFSPYTDFMSFGLNLVQVTLASPNGTVTTWNNLFRWTGSASADYYRLEVYDANDVLIYGQWYTNSICTGLECALSPAATLSLANGDYRWRVQTYGPAGFGPFTEFMSFTLNTAAIALNTPAGNLTSWDNTFSWTGLAGSDYYHLQVYNVDTDELIYDQWYTTSICTGLSCAVSPAETAGLTNGNYKWRVQDYSGFGYGPWSSYLDFNLDR
jgi:hypothetical protein